MSIWQAVCLCATAPPVRQAEYPPWDGAPYFDAGPDRVDVNTAPAAELETLPGIGEKKALAIVEYREANGPFRAVEELERVKGISERRLCRDSGMEGHTLKYHMSDNADWPKPRKAGPHLIYIR